MRRLAIQARASGTVIGVARSSFAIESSGGRMSVVNALTDAANLVTEGDFPYVYGGGHAEAGIASIGITGPGYNGRQIGFDCSGSVAALLAAPGVWQPTSGVPNDGDIVAQLLSDARSRDCAPRVNCAALDRLKVFGSRRLVRRVSSGAPGGDARP
jgi:hypothetical protein